MGWFGPTGGSCRCPCPQWGLRVTREVLLDRFTVVGRGGPGNTICNPNYRFSNAQAANGTYFLAVVGDCGTSGNVSSFGYANFSESHPIAPVTVDRWPTGPANAPVTTVWNGDIRWINAPGPSAAIGYFEIGSSLPYVTVWTPFSAGSVSCPIVNPQAVYEEYAEIYNDPDDFSDNCENVGVQMVARHTFDLIVP